MKEIKAYIKPSKLSALALTLHELEGLTGMSVVDVQGFGRSRVKNAHYRGVNDLVDYVPHLKIEIVCRDEMVEKIVCIIEETAHTGIRGDGNIYVSSIDTAVHIKTGARGESVV